jgi:hypothetical protein
MFDHRRQLRPVAQAVCLVLHHRQLAARPACNQQVSDLGGHAVTFAQPVEETQGDQRIQQRSHAAVIRLLSSDN